VQEQAVQAGADSKVLTLTEEWLQVPVFPMLFQPA
jgi:hypothetical protein